MAYWSAGKNTNSTSEDPKSIIALCYQADCIGPDLALAQPRLPASVGYVFFQLVEVEEQPNWSWNPHSTNLLWLKSNWKVEKQERSSQINFSPT